MKESMSRNVQRVAADIYVSLHLPQRNVTTHISPLPSIIREGVHEPWDSSKRLPVARLVAISPVTQLQATYPKLKCKTILHHALPQFTINLKWIIGLGGH